MSELRQYNTDALFIFPLIADGAQDFVTDYTPAAGDAKVWTDKLISTNPTALILGFDSLSELPNAGDQLDENGAGTAEGVVAFTVIVSGTVGGGDAAGFFFMRSVTGQAWANNDQIDINGGTADIATADSTTYDLAATAGLIGEIGNGLFAAALSPTEMSCAQGEIHIVDSAAKAIEDQAIQFNTFGNANALMAIDFDDAVRAGLTALPNAAADAAGGLPISDVGGLDLDAKLANTNEVTVARMGALTDWINGGRLDLILDIIAADVVNLDGAAMRGTDSAALASVCTEARLAELDAGNLPTDIAAIPTTAMRGTDGALTDKAGFSLSAAGTLAIWHEAVANIVTAASIGKLLKDEITSARMATLTDWINGGRLDLILDAIPTTAMRGTDSAALASVCTEARLAELDGANLPTDVAAIPTTAMRGTDSAALASVATEARLAELDAANLPTDIAAIPTTAMRGTDSAALASVCTEARLAELAAANIPADVDSLITAIVTNAVGADVTADVATLKALLDTTAMSEQASGAPSATPTPLVALMYLFMQWRNGLEQTATERRLKNAAGTEIADATMSDDGTTFDSGIMTAP